MAKPKVLVVDDEAMMRRLLELLLADAGYEVLSAGDGVEAIETIGVRRPDLVILDIMMPRLDGLRTLKYLRAHPATASLPVMLLSAKAESVDIEIGKRAGANDYVTKPFHPADLVARVAALVPAYA